MASVGKKPEAHLIGNRALSEQFLRHIRENRLSHAYILEGREGSGRHTMARFIAAALFCANRPHRLRDEQSRDRDLTRPLPHKQASPLAESCADRPFPCLTCPACRKVYGDCHPDITWIGRDGKASIGVDAIRGLRQDVLLPPNESDTKLYLIEDAERLTVQAQNALLLTLEEPPPYVLFLLLCDGEDALLETIRSRAPVLHMERIPDTTVLACLKERRPSLSDEICRAAVWEADGCIGKALTLSNARTVKPILERRSLTDEFLEACASRRREALPPLIPKFGNKREAVSETISFLMLAVRDLTLIRHGEHVPLKYYTDGEQATALSDRFTERRLFSLMKALTSAAAALEANGNVRLTVTGLCMEALRDETE